jgi:hypothetical protein
MCKKIKLFTRALVTSPNYCALPFGLSTMRPPAADDVFCVAPAFLKTPFLSVDVAGAAGGGETGTDWLVRGARGGRQRRRGRQSRLVPR